MMQLFSPFLRQKLKSLEYFLVDNQDAYHDLFTKISLLHNINRRQREISSTIPSHIRGYCWICSKFRSMLIDDLYSTTSENELIINFRERVVCSGCKCNLRVRFSYHAWDMYCAPKREDHIYITEAVSPLYSILTRKFPSLIGSEFFDTTEKFVKLEKQLVRVEDLQRLSFGDETFEHVLSFDVLEHVPNFLQAIAELHRVTKLGGYIVLSFPFDPNIYDHKVHAVIENGKIRFIGAPMYHGDPVRPDDGVPVFRDFGWRILDELKAAGFSEAKLLMAYSEDFGYVGYPSSIFVLKK